MEAIAAPVRDRSELESVVAAQAREPNGGLIVMPDSFTDAHRVEITSLAARCRLPAVYAYRFFAVLGGLLSYGVDQVEPSRVVSGSETYGTADLASLCIGAVYVTAMTEENDPLARDGNWHRLNISGDPRAMEQCGPNLKVSIGAVTQEGTILARHEVGALIDTGSESCCISPRMVPKMEGGLEGLRNISHVYGRVEGERTIRGAVRFENGVEFVRDFAVLKHLEPYDVLIGRDILKHCRMYMDLGNGRWRLYFPADSTA